MLWEEPLLTACGAVNEKLLRLNLGASAARSAGALFGPPRYGSALASYSAC